MESKEESPQAEEKREEVGAKQSKEKQPAEKKPPKMIPVKRISATNRVVLLEWRDKDGNYRRGELPTQRVLGSEVRESALEAAAPYGMAWEKMLKRITIRPEEIANELRRQGVWTRDDLSRRLPQAKQAFTSRMSQYITAFVRETLKEQSDD
jgi:hypothetical protein